MNISIVDDSLVENDNESFNVTLKRIQAPYQDGRITFNNQTVGVINIKDNEGVKLYSKESRFYYAICILEIVTRKMVRHE